MKKYKLIIVENDEDEQFFMKEGFDATGLFEIIAQVRNGDHLLDWLKENPSVMPQLILSDLNMPGKDGYDVLNEIKANETYEHIPVIITSTSSTRSMMDKCLSLGASLYLVKPETFTEYVPYVQQLHTLIEEKQLVR